MEVLGFGSHFIIDGFQADAGRLADEAIVVAGLEQLAAGLEPGNRTATVRLPFFDGVSAAVVLAESYLALHTFRDRRILSIDLFSRKNIDTQDIVVQTGDRFAVGRFESHLSSRAKVFPHDTDAILKRLNGDRGYVATRLDNTLLAQ
ncbi:MAG: S-adenosylmethionine decarboxylase [Trueperaceae bacterium]|nr:S-adenosylmethionine decarboxylase [Trueperaceae bacterium]